MPTNRAPRTKEHYLENDRRKTYWIESLFENFLWATRFLVLFAVLASLVASLVLFVIGTLDIAQVVNETFNYYVNNNHNVDLHKDVVGMVIGSVDIFLIAVVLLIFSFGLYELFISHIDAANNSESSGILDIESLDQLKDKIGQVIIMALIVKFFQEMLRLTFSGINEMLLFALGIAALSLALFLLHLGKKLGHKD